jgi:cell wall-associated NlpC family hydrolase
MAMSGSTSPALSDAQTQILAFAEAARVASSGKPYTWGGSDTDGFDCSGFVAYVFNKAFGVGNPPRATAEDLRTGPFFDKVTDGPKPADVVFFGSTMATHVAIMVSTERFIGSQSSTGVAYVKFSNPYWAPKILAYGRHTGVPSTTSILPLWAGTFASTIT